MRSLNKTIIGLFLGCLGLFLTVGGLLTYLKNNTHHSPGAFLLEFVLLSLVLHI